MCNTIEEIILESTEGVGWRDSLEWQECSVDMNLTPNVSRIFYKKFKTEYPHDIDNDYDWIQVEMKYFAPDKWRTYPSVELNLYGEIGIDEVAHHINSFSFDMSIKTIKRQCRLLIETWEAMNKIDKTIGRH